MEQAVRVHIQLAAAVTLQLHEQWQSRLMITQVVHAVALRAPPVLY